MTITLRRRLLLACATPLCAFLLATPHAAQTAANRVEDGTRTQRKHQNLSLFTHSENCVACHNTLVAPSGEDVSIGATWRSTMMANSARDPYWQASVRRETLDHPTQSSAIEDECAACHMPMATQIRRANGEKGEVFAHLPIVRTEAPPLQRLASDGISCTVCHQISSERLGTRASFNGEFVIKPTPPGGARVIFGPHKVDAGRKTIMRSVTNFVQAEGPHIAQSELCASCHTLITQALGPNGEVIGSLPEQMNYQEWLSSDFSREGRSCQSCHMPKASGPVRGASVLGDARDTLSRHLFVGGNAFMVRMFNRYRTELGIQALPAELEATARATIRQLQEETATLTLSAPQLTGRTLSVDVDVRNLTGHKYPTGYPARRTWLHVTVRDAQGRAVFESGAVKATRGDCRQRQRRGSADVRTALSRRSRRPTRCRSTKPSSAIVSAHRRPGCSPPPNISRTIGSCRAVSTRGRLTSEIGVYGEAGRDADFVGAGDRVRYRMEVSSAGPFTVEAELRYQPIGYRWAHNLEPYDAPEPKHFVAYYTSMSAESSVVVATARAAVGAGSRP